MKAPDSKGMFVDSTSQDTTAGAQEGGTPPNSRHEALPRYAYWQNTMRPEDTGQSDGQAGIPGPEDRASHFEEQVRDYLSHRLARARNEFASSDADLSARISALCPDCDHYQQLLTAKRDATKRPIVIRLKEGAGSMIIALVTILSAALMFFLWRDKGTDPLLAAAISLFSAVLTCLVAYPCGLTLRQALQPWHKWLAAALLAVLTCVQVATALGMQTPGFELLERGAIGMMITCATMIVAGCAFLMHDEDVTYAGLESKVQDMLPRLCRLEVQRVENRIFHTNVARRHVEIARRVISAYRQANSRARPKGVAEPPFFGQAPQFPEIGDDWLAYLETKQS